MKQLYMFQGQGHVEMREGLTGFSIEVNNHQIFWTDDRNEANRVFYNLVMSLEAT